MDGCQTDLRKNNFALTHPYHEGKSFSKFGLTLTMRGSHLVSLVKFHPVVELA